jgi:radical SAM protein with 4Fe4S-binding SPASM domain
MSLPVAARPNQVFWELTRACDHECIHCRVHAGQPLPDELGPEQISTLMDQLVALQPHRVVLTGGEPLQHPRWQEVVERLSTAGIRVRLFTGGALLSPARLDAALAAGVSEFAISLDGPRSVHDSLRPTRSLLGGSSHKMAVAAIRRTLDRGASLRVVTAASRANLSHLEALYEELCALGVPYWQLHLVQATGRARDHLETLMPRPEQVEHIVQLLLRAARERHLLAPMHCTIGYLVPEEVLTRVPGSDPPVLWRGCRAGLGGFAITARGEVMGCPCLPDSFATASVRERSVSDIWSDDSCFPYSRGWSPDMLEGACKQCAYGRTCRAGCMGVAYGATATIGLNPYCLRVSRGVVGER